MNQARLSKFRYLRKERGLNLEDIARELKVSKAYISMIETGQREANAHTIHALAIALNVSSDYLLNIVDDYQNITPSQSTDQTLSKDEKTMLDAFRTLGPFEREAILIQIKALAGEKSLIKK